MFFDNFGDSHVQLERRIEVQTIRLVIFSAWRRDIANRDPPILIALRGSNRGTEYVDFNSCHR